MQTFQVGLRTSQLLNKPNTCTYVFAGVIGAIDCCHVPILRPSSDDAEEYRNRKGFMSINVQAVCAPDLGLHFTNIVSRWKGSTHDSRIWMNSHLYARFEHGEFEGYLIGDSGYACSSFLLTPVSNPQTAPEQRYNNAHIRTRNPIERAFGLWKARFFCLQNKLRFRPRRCCDIIVATAVLHNFAKKLQEPPVPLNLTDFQAFHSFSLESDNAHGNALRHHVIQSFFYTCERVNLIDRNFTFGNICLLNGECRGTAV